MKENEEKIKLKQKKKIFCLRHNNDGNIVTHLDASSKIGAFEEALTELGYYLSYVKDNE